MEDYYEYLDSNGVTTLYKLIKDDTVALIDSYSVTINGITTNLDSHVNNTDIHTPISDIENMVDTKVSGLVNSAPETLDTLKELSDALGNDPNFATTVANQIGNKASKDDVYTKEDTDTLLEGKADSVHNHVVKDITDFPTIPTKTSELSNDSNFVTSTELHDYATKNDLNSKQDALSEEQLSNIDSIPDKANKSDLSTVATSGSYKDLLDKPVLPEGADLSDYYNKGETDNLLNSKANTSDLAVVAKSGNYNDLNNTPTIPTKVSQLENDTGFVSGLTDVVDTKSNQTINGVKTFTASPFVSNYAVTNGFFTKLNTIARNEVPSQIHHSAFRVFDKNSKTLGEYCVEKSTSGSSLLHMDVHTEDSEGNDIMESVYLNLSNDGSTVSFHPAKNNRIDLGMSHYKWAKIYSDDVVHTSGDETIEGTKTFTGIIKVSQGTLQVGSDTGYNVTYSWNGNIVSKQPSGTFNISLPKANGTLAIDENLVHTSGNETIAGFKSFTEVLDRRNDVTTSTVATATQLVDTNANRCGWIANRMHWAGNYHVHNRHIAYNENSGKEVYIDIISSNNGSGGLFVGGSATNRNLNDVTSATDYPVLATMGWVNNPATSTNVVHKTGNETINGVKSFNNLMYIYDNMSNKNSQMDLFTTPANTLYAHYMFVDKNNVVSAYMQYGQQNTGTDFIGLFIHDKNRALHGIQVTTNNEVKPISNNTYSLGSSSNRWANVHASRINCDNIVRTVENSYIYMTAGPAWNSGASIFLNGKSGDGNGTGAGSFTLYARNASAERYLLGRPDGILKWTGCIESHEFRSTNGNAFMAQNGGYTFLIRNDGSNTYLLMSDKDGTPGTWSTARPLIINNSTGVCSINGHADSANYADVATYSTTQATSDNSTKIATTAWVRTYVNSVVGSGAVGASISAYYSNATTVTATGDATGTTTGVYPADYSNYINIAPTVGTIYTGSQLFSSFTPTASGTIDIIYPGPSVIIYQTTAYAKATFSGAFSASAKYLCTTANAVKFRAYVSQGTSSTMGTPSVVDNSSAKSIFIRVQ